MHDWMEIYEAVSGPVAKYSIYNLAGIKADQLGRLEDAGISLMDEIPAGFSLTDRQERQITAIKTGQRAIDHTAIKSVLDEVNYPLYFLDYETFSDVVPVFDGTRPYQQVPFQYSLHIRRAPGAELEHLVYLHEENSNPVPALLDRLQKDLGNTGNVVV